MKVSPKRSWSEKDERHMFLIHANQNKGGNKVPTKKVYDQAFKSILTNSRKV